MEEVKWEEIKREMEEEEEEIMEGEEERLEEEEDKTIAIKAKREEKLKITYPEQISDFWRKPIYHEFSDIYFEIYYVEKLEDGRRRWLPVNLPPDPKTGRILPPFTEEEVLEAGYGAGTYVFRPRSLMTGKLIKGSETHILGISHEYKQREHLQKVIENRRNQPLEDIGLPKIQQSPMDVLSILNILMKQQENTYRIIMEQQNKMLELIKQANNQRTPLNLETQVTAIVASLMNVLKEAEKSKATIETKRLEVEKELKLKEYDFKSKLESLKSQLEGLPEDEKILDLKRAIEELEGRIDREKKPENIFTAFVNGINEFIKNISPIIETLQRLQNPQPLEKFNPPSLKFNVDDKVLDEIEKELG